ncbi:MAG TPA: hypothetical protein VF765_35585 [Polyangiaceae bacterium]
MNVVTRIMRQHRHIQRLHGLVKVESHPCDATMADLVEAVLVHTSSTEMLLAKIRDERVERDVEAHRVHHSRAKLAFFRVATCPQDVFARELAQLESVLREHAQHEAKVVQSLTHAFGEEVLEVLGDQMEMLEPTTRAEPAMRIERCA